MWEAIGIKAAGSIIDRGLSMLGGGGSTDQAAAAAAENWRRQEEFAKNGISWRVADAQRAGIHPLYALGASIPSFSPATYIPEHEPSADWSGVGQDISRAVLAAQDGDTRTENKMNTLAIERAELENELIRSRIARERAQLGPPLPSASATIIPGQEDTRPLVENKPMERTATAPGAAHQEPGAIPDVGYSQTPRGLAPVPSKDVKERIEDMALASIPWMWRNQILPNFGGGDKPDRRLLPEGAVDWTWSASKQEWVPLMPGEQRYLPERIRNRLSSMAERLRQHGAPQTMRWLRSREGR